MGGTPFGRYSGRVTEIFSAYFLFSCGYRTASTQRIFTSESWGKSYEMPALLETHLGLKPFPETAA